MSTDTVSSASATLNFGDVIAASAAGFWVIDEAGLTVHVNEAMASMLGTTVEAMLGHSFLEFMDAGDVPLAGHYLQRSLEGHAEMHEFRFRRPDGTALWAMVSTGLTTGPDGRTLVTAFCTDVSDLQRFRRLAASLGANFSRLVADSPYAMAVVDETDRIRTVNRAFEVLVGRLSADAVGRSIGEFSRPVDGGGHGHLAGDEASRPASHVVRIAVGSHERQLRAIVLPLTGEAADMSAVHCFMEDCTTESCDLVTQRAELEHRIREKTAAVALQARAMDATMEGMAILKNGTYVYMNDAHAAMYGWTAEALLGRSWRDLYAEATQRWLDAVALPQLQRERQWRGELVGLRQDGTEVDVEVSLALGPDSSIICSCRDISERKSHERQMAAALQALDAANVSLRRAGTMKDEFLACMSHELRTPLHSILTAAELLSEGISGPLTDGQRRYLQQIESSGQHLVGLLSDLLDASKIEAGQLDLQREWTELDYLLDVSIEMVARDAERKGLTLWKPATWPSSLLYVDARRIVQVLVNLLSNAVKFTPSGGRIALEARCSEATVAITVQDSGIGIADEDQPRLFGLFSQIDSSLTRESGGSGLGLYLSRRIARMHGGDVRVDSQAGVGSCFTLVLPLAAADTGIPSEDMLLV